MILPISIPAYLQYSTFWNLPTLLNTIHVRQGFPSFLSIDFEGGNVRLRMILIPDSGSRLLRHFQRPWKFNDPLSEPQRWMKKRRSRPRSQQGDSAWLLPLGRLRSTISSIWLERRALLAILEEISSVIAWRFCQALPYYCLVNYE